MTKLRTTASLVIPFLLACAVGHSQPPDTAARPPATILRARELLRTGNIDQATAVLQSARSQAASTGAKADEASALFYLGVVQQARIQTQDLPARERQAANTAAISAYREAIQANPASGPALNNLAQLYRVDPGKREEADALFARAIALDDPRKGVYLLNRAALKRDLGNIPAALQLAEQAATRDRADLNAHRMVVSVALASASAAPLLAYIKDLNDAGLVARALDTAVSAMRRFSEDRSKLLISIGESLGNSAYSDLPPAFADTEAGRTLQQFRDDAAIGAGVRELMGVLQEPVSPESLRWWRRGYDEHRRVVADSPPAVMQNLTRRCADIYRSTSDLARAERYYRLSIEFSGAGTDPRAFVSLAEILFASGRIDELSRLLDRYEQPLLDNKISAIEQSDYRQIYELRLTLGTMYAYTGRWTNPRAQFKGAIWMLEHAQKSATDYNKGRPVPEQIGLPPEAVKLLSQGYSQGDKTEDAIKSVTVRLDAAERYLAAGQRERAADVLDETWRRTLPNTLPASVTQRLEAITAQL